MALLKFSKYSYLFINIKKYLSAIILSDLILEVRNNVFTDYFSLCDVSLRKKDYTFVCFYFMIRVFEPWLLILIFTIFIISFVNFRCSQ